MSESLESNGTLITGLLKGSNFCPPTRIEAWWQPVGALEKRGSFGTSGFAAYGLGGHSARRFYERHGLVLVHTIAPRHHMKWRPPASRFADRPQEGEPGSSADVRRTRVHAIHFQSPTRRGSGHPN